MRKFTVYPGKYVKADSATSGTAMRRTKRDFGSKALGRAVDSSKTIKAERVKSKFDDMRKLLGEKEWYYIEEYLINGDSNHSLRDILYKEDAWDDYCDWKMEKYHLKPSISASTRIKARRYLK